MADRVGSLLDLPVDVLLLIYPYLDVKSFLALCSTCKTFNDPSTRFEPSFWRHATRSTFRIPNQPVVQEDGERWQKMYRRLLTQSRVFTWGSHGFNRLGHNVQSLDLGSAPHPGGQRWVNTSNHCGYPAEMNGTRELGIIADMQCGGWSTTLLTSNGRLYSVGIFDGMHHFHDQAAESGPHALEYPSGYSQSAKEAREPSTAIRQFSSGRSHVLGLSDSGRIWSWNKMHDSGLRVKFLHLETREGNDEEARGLYGRVRQVRAGWTLSSAYIWGTGIVLWSPASEHHEDVSDTELILITDSIEVPKTSYYRARKGSSRESDEDQRLGAEVGEVINYILLERFVVFVTDLGKVFAARIGESNSVQEILELRALRSDSGSRFDVQGAFRSFAVFKNGEVITAHQDYLEARWSARHTDPEQTDIEGLRRIPCLQHNDVISVSFGDYHFLALHSNGKITAYGSELQGCGALGLGGDGIPEGFARGVRNEGFRQDGKLLPHAYNNGREVWFQREKRKWLMFMMSGGCDRDESSERIQWFMEQSNVQGEVSEWFEQEGRNWDRDPEVKDANDDGLGAHFALSVSAAGWHSGAIVLVNDALEDRVRQKCVVRDTQLGKKTHTPTPDQEAPQRTSRLQHALRRVQRDNMRGDPTYGRSPEEGFKYVWADKPFPRLRLSDGREMPGTVEFNEWRYGRPEWQLDVGI